jgi:DNA-binding transcriptional regulator YiaG
MATLINPQARSHGAGGRFTGGVLPRAVIQSERRKRAAEWRQFRQDYLFSQSNLAAALQCSKRTVQNVEAGASTPMLALQRRFRALVRREKAAAS